MPPDRFIKTCNSQGDLSQDVQKVIINFNQYADSRTQGLANEFASTRTRTLVIANLFATRKNHQ